MRRLWQDVQTHRRAAVWFFVYWLVTTVAAHTVWFDTKPGWLLLATSPLIAGALVGGWRSSERIRGGILAGVLTGALAAPAMDVTEVIRWIQHGRVRGFRLDEALGLSIFFVVLGTLLGLAGAVLATINRRFGHQGK